MLVDNGEISLPHFDPEMEEFSRFRVNYFAILGYVLTEYLTIPWSYNLTSHSCILLSRARLLTPGPDKIKQEAG